MVFETFGGTHVGTMACHAYWYVMYVGMSCMLVCLYVGVSCMLVCNVCWCVMHVGVSCMLVCHVCWCVMYVGVSCMLVCYAYTGC